MSSPPRPPQPASAAPPVKLAGFTPFLSAVDALNQCNAISEGIMTDELRNFLELNLPKVKEGKKAKFRVVQELLRAVRLHFDQFIDQLKPSDLEKAHSSHLSVGYT